MSSGVAVRPAEPADSQFIETVLRRNDLVVPDESPADEATYVCERDGERIGIAALERYGDAALLRSVAIDDGARDRGYGTQLCTRLLERAGANGVADVYLFTGSAATFFETLGFERIDRESVPESIRATTEARQRCRSAAVPMKRALGAEAADAEAGAS